MNQTKKHTTGKKLLALLLALIMSVSLLPMSVFAADLGTEAPIVEGQTQQDAALDESSGEEEIVDSQEPVVEDPAPVQEDTTEDDVDTLAMGDEAAVQADEEEVKARDTSNDGFIRIFHLDCGRKYFSVSEIEGIIDQLAENNYTHIQLAFGNNGFRFLLDDMKIEANGTTYSSTDVRNAITSGNSAYSSKNNTASTMLSESNMDTIIGYAQGVGISVIPMLNTPGHMDALVSAMKTLGIRSSTGSEMSLTSENEVNFIKALQQKYITYFAGKGSNHYNLAADEYSFSGLSSTEYTAFAQYVNDVAKMVKKAGMTPMAYNDGIYYSGKTTSVAFDTDIQICYWAQDTNYASVTDLANRGFTIINNNDAWYYVLGDYLYEKWSNGQWGYQSAMNAIINTPVTQAKNAADKAIDLAGSVLCCWCDGPHIGYTDTGVSKGTAPEGQTNQQSVYALIKAMAQYNPDQFEPTASTEPELVVDDTAGNTVTPTKQSDSSYKVTVKANDTVKLKANNVAEGVTLNWSTNKAAVATVDQSGKVTFTGEAGIVTITAKTATVTYAADDNSTVLEAIFVVAQDTGEVPVTENKTITVTIGGTATATISGANYSGKSYQTKDTSIATVESVTGTDATESVPKYTANTSYVYNISGTWGATWTKTEYYYKVGENYYPCYVKYQNSKYYWGYSVNDSATSVIEAGNSYYWYKEVTVYSMSGTASKPASTTIVFKGVAKGTTEVTIGDTHYTINVVAEDLTDAATLPIQLWITNVSIEVTGVTTKGSGQFNDYNNGGYAQYVTAKAEDAYGEDGVSLSELVPSAVKNNAATSIDDADATYSIWKGVVLNTTTGLQKYWWTDMTMASGRTDYQYVRYFGGAWAVSADRVDWTIVTGEGSTGASSSCKEQVIAYYMQRTNVTKEVITDVVDWGNTTDKWAENAPTQYAVLDFAVQYPDQRVPDTFPVPGKTVYFHCNEKDETGVVHQDDDSNYYRRIGMIKGVDTTNYEVYMITVTPTSDTVTVQLTNSSTALTTSTTIEYKGTEKVAWVDDEANLPANFRSDAAKFHSISGTFNYTVGGAANLQGLEIYQRQGMLVTYYLRAKVNKDTLHVHYIDKTANVEFHNYDINVNEGTFFDENIGLNKTTADSWKGPLVNGTVPNDQTPPVNQTVSADLSTMPAIGAQYRFGNYKCEEVVRSGDGKEVFLYYTFVAVKTFVVDFGLPLNIKPTDVSANLSTANITAVQFDKSYYATITEGENFSINYTLNKTIDGVDNFQIVYKGTNLETEEDGTATFTITVIPASTVYYEDSFAKFYGSDGAEQKSFEQTGTSVTETPGTWYVDGNELTSMPDQALEELGKKNNVYGYDPVYNNSTTFSMGSAKKVTVDATKFVYDPTVKFTFKGTGFDVISLTDNNSGAIVVNVERKDTNTTGYEAYNKNFLVNNYYGYSYDKTTHEWTVDNSAENNALYQIPVMKVTGLPYGEYAVTITVGYGEFFDKTNDGKYSFWMDAIRVYDPMGKDYADYTQDQEGYPQYIKLRDALASGEATPNENLLFIDGADKAEVTLYKNYGPNNEVYLAGGQAISFKLTGDLGKIATIQVGAKKPDGSDAVMIVNNENVSIANSATEMYYTITRDNNNCVTITNTGADILSLTNLKVTFTSAGTVSLTKTSTQEQANAVAAVRALFTAPEPDPEPVVFAPEYFQATWNRGTVKVGQKATLTVKTSTDVETVTVNGQDIGNYRVRTERTGWGWNAKKVTYHVFTYTVTAAEAGALDVSVAAVNAEGVSSAAVTATLTVQAASQRPGIGGWLDNIFGRWF